MPLNRKHITSVLDTDLEAKEFIHGKRLSSHPATQVASHPATQAPARQKLSIRLPKNLHEVLTHVWYERGQARTQGTLPEGQVFEKQDIIAEALREWFEKRGYLKSQEE
jgi:hypothetical protein